MRVRCIRYAWHTQCHRRECVCVLQVMMPIFHYFDGLDSVANMIGHGQFDNDSFRRNKNLLRDHILLRGSIIAVCSVHLALVDRGVLPIVPRMLKDVLSLRSLRRAAWYRRWPSVDRARCPAVVRAC